MKKSDSIVKLGMALAKAQAEMPTIKMNAQNPFLKNKYADLGAVISGSRPVLAKYGLAIAQTPVSDGDKIGVTTLLVHESGEWLEDTILITPTNSKGLSDAQNAGVVISYLRRYSWSSILGLHADEDNDGHQEEQPKKKPEAKPSTRERYENLLVEAKQFGVDIEPYKLPEVITDSEIVELGKALRQEVESKKKEVK
jgi:hypothetical protein